MSPVTHVDGNQYLVEAVDHSSSKGKGYLLWVDIHNLISQTHFFWLDKNAFKYFSKYKQFIKFIKHKMMDIFLNVKYEIL